MKITFIDTTFSLFIKHIQEIKPWEQVQNPRYNFMSNQPLTWLILKHKGSIPAVTDKNMD